MDPENNLFKNPWVAMGLPALTLLLGIQLMKALFPLLLYVLGDHFGWTAVNIGLLALLLCSLGFLAQFLQKLINGRVVLIISVLGVGITRLALQLWPDNPTAYLLLCCVGTVCFILFFPIYMAAIRPQGTSEVGIFGLGLQIGLILSVVFNGMADTYEINWQSGFIYSLIVVILVFLQAGCLAGMLFKLPSAATNDQDTPTLKQALPWAAYGPFIFLQLLLFLNIAQISAITGYDLPLAFALSLAGAVMGFLGAGAVFWRGTNRMEVIGGGIVLLIILAITSGTVDFIAALYIIGPLMLAEWFMVILMNIEQGNGRYSIRNLTISNGIGWTLFVIFIFLYYAGYQLALPFANNTIIYLAFLLCFLAGLAAISAFPRTTVANKLPASYSLGVVALILIILVGIKFFTRNQPETVSPSDQPVRIMTYNLHNGVNPPGQLNLEAIAQTIEEQNPDVVAVQEVSRGWVVNGSADMLQWLSQRLEMPYVWGPTEGETWGNAVFSRYPISEFNTVPLPPENLLLHRGLILVELDTGGAEPLTILNTHYHHIEGDSDIRTHQSQVVLDVWQERPFTILVGDLNAPPSSPEMMRIQEAGFVEGVAAAGVSPGYTFISTEPTIQLDYIWYTPDLSAADLLILDSQASDHLGIATNISGN